MSNRISFAKHDRGGPRKSCSRAVKANPNTAKNATEERDHEPDPSLFVREMRSVKLLPVNPAGLAQTEELQKDIVTLKFGTRLVHQETTPS